MSKKTLIVSLALALAGGAAIAQINAERHPHMAAAQKYGKMAYEELNKVDKANKPAADAHVQKAQQLLQQADSELIAAAQAADGK